MKVKLLVGVASADWSLSPGDEHECSEAEAARLFEAGFAERVTPPAPAALEKAVKAPPAETR